MKFNFYGFHVQIDYLQKPELIPSICQDFIFFQSLEDCECDLIIRIEEKKFLQQKGFCFAKTPMCQVRQVSWNQRQLLYIHLNKPVVAVLDFRRGGGGALHLEVADPSYLEEILYFALNSVVGEYFDSKGLMRLHAAGIQLKGSNFVFTGTSGAGKSTLTDHLVRHSLSRVFSDEMVLLDLKTREVLPFPIRRSLKSDISKTKGLSFFVERDLKSIDRQQVALRGPLSSLIQLRPSQSTGLRMSTVWEKITLSWEIFWGLGVIQMWEYLLRLNNFHVLFVIAWNRIRLLNFIWSQSTEVFERSGSSADNLKTLETLLSNR